MKAFLGGCQAVFVYKDTSRRSFFSILRNFLQCPGTRVWFEVLVRSLLRSVDVIVSIALGLSPGYFLEYFVG